MIDGEGENTRSEEFRRRGASGRDGVSERFFVVAGIGAEAVRRGEIRNEKIDGTITLRLEGELAFELQGGSEQGRQDKRFGEQAGNRGRIIVATENAVEKRSELDRPAAHVEPFHLEGHDT